MEFVKLLLSDDVERAHFAADPDGTLAQHGLGDLSPADVHDAVVLVQDTLTVDWAQAYGTGAGAAHPRPPSRGRAGSAGLVGRRGHPIRWSSTTTRRRRPPSPTVDDALFDAPDLHFGH